MADHLGAFEQAVLLAVVRLGEHWRPGRAILKEVQTQVSTATSRPAPFTRPLNDSRKKVVSSRLGPGTPVRAGRAKRCYRLQPKGVRALNDARAAIDSLWEGLRWPLKG